MTESAKEPVLLRQDEDGIVTLTLNRPDQFNALSEELLAALLAALSDIATDESARCVIVAAKGRAFCAGHDLKEMQANRRKDYYQELFAQCSDLMKAITALPVPVIARVHGLATAAGCQLVAACDMAVAVEEAKFAVSGINVGLFCSTPAVALSRKVPRAKAFEMLVTGKFISAAEALEHGLVNAVCTEADLDTAVADLTGAICAKSPIAVRMGKALFYRQIEAGLTEAYDIAAETMACNMMTEDADEGIGAFIDKRKPEWKGC